MNSTGADLTGVVFDIQRFSLHDGPGIRTSVFLKGCPLRCAWCSNPESQDLDPETMWSRRDQRPVTVGSRMSVGDVMAVVRRDQDYYEHSGGGMTLTGGEFMLQPEFSAALIDAAHAEGITVVGETAGRAPAGVFASLVGRLDLVLMDIKHHDDARHVQHTHAPQRLILDNAASLVRSRTPHVFRIPVVPGVNDTPQDAEAFAALFHTLGVSSVELMLFHQFGKGKYVDLGRDYAFTAAKSMTEADLARYRERLEGLGVTTSVNQ